MCRRALEAGRDCPLVQTRHPSTFHRVESGKKSGIIKYTSIKKKDLRDLTEKIILEKNPHDNYNALISTNIDTLCIDEKSIEAFLAHEEAV